MAKVPKKERGKVVAPMAVDARRGASVGPLLERVVAILDEARARVARSVNSEMVLAYWTIGRELVAQVQDGNARAGYGEELIDELSRRLTERLGRGFSTTNLRYFRTFYLAYSGRSPEIRHLGSGEFSGRSEQRKPEARRAGVRHTRGGVLDAPAAVVPELKSLQRFSAVLGWTHYRLLMNVGHEGARRFYEIEAERGAWSVEHLERQIHTQLFARLLKSRDKAGVLDLASRGQVVQRPVDLLKAPYVLDFLELPESPKLRESDLEGAILEKLQHFLLELGKGFAFVARQRRLSFDDEHFYVDLVFYNVILKCYLLVDLKLGKLAHQDVGQMDSYVRLFDELGRAAGDGPTIGLILCAEKNDAVARYSVLHGNEQLFAAKYVTYLPSVKELEQELARGRRLLEMFGGAGKRRPRAITGPGPRRRRSL